VCFVNTFKSIHCISVVFLLMQVLCTQAYSTTTTEPTLNETTKSFRAYLRCLTKSYETRETVDLVNERLKLLPAVLDESGLRLELVITLLLPIPQKRPVCIRMQGSNLANAVLNQVGPFSSPLDIPLLFAQKKKLKLLYTHLVNKRDEFRIEDRSYLEFLHRLEIYLQYFGVR
jgi:hypothetical protein